MSLVKKCLKQLKRDLDIVDERMSKWPAGHVLSNRVHATINKLLKEVGYFEKRNNEIPIEVEYIQWDLQGNGDMKFKLKENEDIRHLDGKRFKIVYLDD